MLKTFNFIINFNLFKRKIIKIHLFSPTFSKIYLNFKISKNDTYLIKIIINYYKIK